MFKICYLKISNQKDILPSITVVAGRLVINRIQMFGRLLSDWLPNTRQNVIQFLLNQPILPNIGAQDFPRSAFKNILIQPYHTMWLWYFVRELILEIIFYCWLSITLHFSSLCVMPSWKKTLKKVTWYQGDCKLLLSHSLFLSTAFNVCTRFE